VLLNVLKKNLVLILIESFLYSWIFNLIILDSWFLKLESWNLILESWIQISLDSWSVLDSILNSFSWAFCHHLCYHQNSLNQFWFIIMKFASTWWSEGLYHIKSWMESCLLKFGRSYYTIIQPMVEKKPTNEGFQRQNNVSTFQGICSTLQIAHPFKDDKQSSSSKKCPAI